MNANRLWIALTVTSIVAAGVTSSPGLAQGLGTFRWQFQPFCNVVTLTVEQKGASFVLTGHDDQCGGGAPRAADGNTGPFVFNPATVSGSPRPAPTTSALITTTQIGAEAVTPDKLAASIFSGTGSATTVARSDHLHDDRYYTRAQTDAGFLARSAAGPRGLIGQALVNFNGTLSFHRASNGQTITVTKAAGAGVYNVTFPGFGFASPAAFDQSIQLTATGDSGTFWRSCALSARLVDTGTGIFTATVTCVNSAFAAADATFFITVLA